MLEHLLNQMNARTIFRYVLRTLLSLSAAVLLYLLTALMLSRVSTHPKSYSCESSTPYFVTTNGIHLDIVVPRSFFERDPWEGLVLAEHIQYVAIGWGDKGFYLETPTWDDLKLSTALQALFWKSDTAMHLTYYRRSLSNWKKLTLCPEQVLALENYIYASFQKTESGQLQEIPDSGYTAQDVFFEAQGSYSIFRTCNNWANQALKAAQVKTAVWAPFDWAVLHYL